MPEVRVRGARRDDQEVVPHFAAVGAHDHPARWIDRRNLGEQHLHVALAAQHPADGRGDVAGRQTGRRHLIQERLEQMMIAAIDECNAYVAPPERLRSVQTAETTSDDDDVRR
jgi:hypothetical protein